MARVRSLLGALADGRQSQGAINVVGAALILVSGLIHLILSPEHFEEATYLGWLFLADFAGAAVAAWGIYRGQRWGWVLGAVLALGAFVAYFIDGTVGLPGAEGHHFLEPVGVVAKAVEGLFLVLCALKFTESLAGTRRWALVGALAAVLLLVPGLALALGLPGITPARAESSCASTPVVDNDQNKMPGWPLRWKATSPAIQEGDRYSLVVKNPGEEPQQARVRTVIMDHRNQTNTNVINEDLELAPGEQCELTAVNDYGPANHFNTIIGSETEDLDLAVTVADAAGEETARFSDRAFMVQEVKAKGKGKAKDKAHDEGKAHDHPR
jgi:hypothetical protein